MIWKKEISLLPVAPWLHRTFNFDIPVSMYPNLVERVRGGPARLEDAVSELPEPLLTRRRENAWSIQEHVGHLWDIEPLMSGRLEDFISHRPELRAWEETNKATWDAQHNLRPLQQLLKGFREARFRLVAGFEHVDDLLIDQVSFHPRLKKQMRIIDLVYFVAEHDDYHLSKISEIKYSMNKEGAS